MTGDAPPATAELQLGIFHRSSRDAKILNPDPTVSIRPSQKE
jgi:hypothetical protein